MSWKWWVRRRLVVYLCISSLVLLLLLSLSCLYFHCQFSSVYLNQPGGDYSGNTSNHSTTSISQTKSDFIFYSESNLCNPEILCGLTWSYVVWHGVVWHSVVWHGEQYENDQYLLWRWGWAVSDIFMKPNLSRLEIQQFEVKESDN